MTTKMDQIIEKMWAALRRPATTMEELAERVSDGMGETIGAAYLTTVMQHLRKHCLEYGWNVPHVKRGPATEADEGRFFRCLVDRDGEYYFDENPESLKHMANGTYGTVKQTVTMSRNQVAMLTMQVEHVRSLKARAKLREYIDDYSYATRKMANLLGTLEEERDTAKAA